MNSGLWSIDQISQARNRKHTEDVCKRGYIPDGSGVWYGESVCEQYAPCCNDDDLNLYFLKRYPGRFNIVKFIRNN